MAIFGVWDYVVLVLMLVVSASIGVYYRFTGGKQKTNNEYFLADRSTPVFTVACSLMASFMSAITLLGVAMENYQYGSIFIVINISYGLATPIAAYLFLPVFYQLQATSAYEYLERRFGHAARLCASIAYSLQMIFYMGIVLYAPAIALEAVTGINRVSAILAIGLVCTFYSTIGGMKAVLVTDVFQSLLMFAAVYSVIVCAAIKAGGLGPIWDTAMEGGRLNFLNFNPDPTTRHSWWSLIIGGGFTYLTLYAVNQTQIQRLLTVKSLKASQGALWLNWPILSLLSLSTSFSGLAIYYLYSKCDPLLQGRINNRDQLMPLFVVDAMGVYPGLSGLFVSGIFSASLSTVSAAVNSLAAVTLEDYLKPLVGKVRGRPMENTSAFVSKLLALFYGFVCIGIAFLAQYVDGILQASLTIFGVVGGPLFGLFSLGMFVPAGNQRGAIIGLFTGLAFAMTLGLGRPKPAPPTLAFSMGDCRDFDGVFNATLSHIEFQPDTTTYFPWIFKLSYLWYGVIGWVVTFFVGWIASLVLASVGWGGEHKIYTDDQHMYVNTNLFSPPIAKRLKARNARRMECDENYVNGDRLKESHTQF